MTLTPALSGIARAEERLRNMLAACAEFQRWAGAWSVAAARESVYLCELPNIWIGGSGPDGTFARSEIASRRPFALVWTADSESYAIDVVASPATPNPSGVLCVRFEESVPDDLAENYAEAYRRFLNTVGLILQSNERHAPGLLELLEQRRPDALDISRMALLNTPIRTTEEDAATMGDAHFCDVQITWGARA